MMQEIEQATQGVIVGYEAQVEQSNGFHAITAQLQRYDDQQLVQRRKKRPGKTRPFNEDLEETVARNDAKVQQAMTDRKRELG